jgi:tetratricopeptide (TPR) repeat protein
MTSRMDSKLEPRIAVLQKNLGIVSQAVSRIDERTTRIDQATRRIEEKIEEAALQQTETRQTHLLYNAESERRHREMLAAISREKGVPIEGVQRILVALGQTDVPPDEILDRLRDAVDELLAKSREKVRPSNEGSAVDDALASARGKLVSLDTTGAIAVLDQRIHRDDASSVGARRRATLLREKADIQRLSYDYAGAIATLEEAVREFPERFGNWIALGDLRRTVGSLRGAHAAFENALAIATRFGSERGQALALNRLGDVLKAQGERERALTVYREGLAIREALLAKAPDDPTRQRNVSFSYNRIGDVLRELSDRDGALDAYRRSLQIREILVSQDADDTGWQRDLSNSFDRIGDILLEEGDHTGALAAYRKSLTIREKLAAENAASAARQRATAVSHSKVGDALRSQGDAVGALAAYRKSLEVAEALARNNPSNTSLQRQLSFYLNRVGDVLVAERKHSDALAVYRRALMIREQLASLDPAHAGRQLDLALSYMRMATVESEAAARHLGNSRQLIMMLRDSGRLAPSNAHLPAEVERRLADLR